MYNGTHITLVVGQNDSVDRLKQQITQKTGIPENQQLLSYSGKKLENGKKISQYRIRNMSTLQLLTQVSGG
jgi:ubiquitin C